MQRDNVALYNLANNVLTLEECEKLARQKFKFSDVYLNKIIQDDNSYKGHDNKKIAILVRWKEMNHQQDASAVKLANHIASLSLSRDRMEKALEILEVSHDGM